MVKDMDQWLADYAKIAKESFTKADADKPGTGAAGGLGFAFLTFTNTILKSGVDLILHETKLEEEIKDADIVITGEGCLDAQTAMGKAPIGVAKLAKKYGKLVLGFSGAVAKGATACRHGCKYFSGIICASSNIKILSAILCILRNFPRLFE